MILNVSRRQPTEFPENNKFQCPYTQRIVEAKLRSKDLQLGTLRDLETLKTPIIQLCESYAGSMAQTTHPSWDKKYSFRYFLAEYRKNIVKYKII